MTTSAQIQAFNKINGAKATTIEEMILFTITSLQTTGATKKELELILQLKHQTLTGRMSSLQKNGFIYHKDEIKDGCTIFYATPFHFVEEYRKKQYFWTYQKLLNRLKAEYQVSDQFIVNASREFAEKHGDVIQHKLQFD